MRVFTYGAAAITSAGCFAQAGQAALQGGDIMSIGTPLTIGGAAAWLLMYHLPRKDKEHREEREAVIARMDEKDREHAQVLRDITAQHVEATRTGHEAAQKLAGEIRSLREKIEGIE